MKKVRKLIIGLVFIILLIMGGLYLHFFKVLENEMPSLPNLNGTSLSLKTSKPIYYYNKNKLYYSPTGSLDYGKEHIFSGKVSSISISPNSKYAFINDSEDIILINSTGQVVYNFSNDSPNRLKFNSGSYESMQWYPDSENLLFSFDIEEVNLKDSLVLSYIYEFNIQDKSFSRLYKSDEKITEYYPSKSGSFIYYEFVTEKGDFGFKSVDLRSNSVNTMIADSLIESTDDIFINYDIKDFQGYSYDTERLVVTINSKSFPSGYYYHSDSTNKHMLGGDFGYLAFKGASYDFEKKGYFLPLNKYYLSQVEADEFNGTILFDTQSFQYQLIDSKLEAFFSITNKDHPEFEHRYDIEPKIPDFATSVQNDIHEQFRTYTAY